MSEPSARELWVGVLERAHVAGATRDQLDLDAIATDTGASNARVRQAAEMLERFGLMHTGLDAPGVPYVTAAGHQFITLDGNVSLDSLGFLSGVVDDLHARQALLDAGHVLVDEFEIQINAGDGVEHARWRVPPAFAPAVDEALALRLYGAAVALMARLASDRPAACVAEEIMAVFLLEGAQLQLEMRVDAGELTPEEAGTAAASARDIFDLFGDEDVFELFDMEEPSDAAVEIHTERHRQMGVADRRLNAWFDAFGGSIATGNLNELDEAPTSSWPWDPPDREPDL